MWSKADFRAIPEIAESPQMPVRQGVRAFQLCVVGWMLIRSQTMRREPYCTWKKQENSCRYGRGFCIKTREAFQTKAL